MSSRRPARRQRAAWTVAAAAVVLLSGCATTAPIDPPTSGSAVLPTSPPPTSAGPPALHPDGTAGDNLPLFAAVTQQVWRTGNKAKGRAYVDALVKAGFDKSAMQVTPDKSTVGNAAESLQFAVRWGDECLVGQVGPATGKPVTTVMPGLQDGGCLIGITRTIDW